MFPALNSDPWWPNIIKGVISNSFSNLFSVSFSNRVQSWSSFSRKTGQHHDDDDDNIGLSYKLMPLRYFLFFLLA